MNGDKFNWVEELKFALMDYPPLSDGWHRIMGDKWESDPHKWTDHLRTHARYIMWIFTRGGKAISANGYADDEEGLAEDGVPTDSKDGSELCLEALKKLIVLRSGFGKTYTVEGLAQEYAARHPIEPEIDEWADQYEVEI